MEFGGLIHAVLFDVDSTLLRGQVGDAVEATCDRISGAYPDLLAAELIAANSRVWKAHGVRLEDEWTIGLRDGASVAAESWRMTLAECECRDESIVRVAAGTYIQEESKTFRLFDDVLPVMEHIRSLGLRTGVVINGASDSQREKLRATEALHWLDAVVTSAEVGIAKPDPRIFRIALQQLGASPQNTLHIGDTPATDVAGAQATGLKAVWVNRKKRQLETTAPPPDYEVSSFSDLVPLLSSRGGPSGRTHRASAR